MNQQLILTALPGIPLVQPGDELVQLIANGLRRAEIEPVGGDVLVIAQKIVSKAEGRLVKLSEVEPSAEANALAAAVDKEPALVELILQESRAVLRTRPGLMIVEHRLGFVCANAGIDRSNVGGEADEVLLLPLEPDATAQTIRAGLAAEFGVELGVLIVDSHGRAWRMGTVGVAIGVAGFPALQDLRGRPDLFGRTLEITQVGLADEVAAAASILMGQAGESAPVVHLRGLPYPLREGTLAELIRPQEEDLFR
jgi:coenzyme F420-0:L-glutamate ligase/coenzyme F420-1:gamma-L-glutamate ligase